MIIVQDILNISGQKMEKLLNLFKQELSSIRAGRANINLLDKITIDYYGVETSIKQVANIAVPEAHMIVIQPWGKDMLVNIEKAIQKSDIGINPTNDGIVIRLAFPQLTMERRKKLVKIVYKTAENNKIIIRNIRREGNEQVRKIQKDSIISEDKALKSQEEIQKLTDLYIKKIEILTTEKEKEILEI